MKAKIKIVPKGPYIITGGVPLSEKIIEPKGRGYAYREGRALKQADTYALCRCGQSKATPFCDGTHTAAGFTGQETASNAPFAERADLIRGPGLDMYDDGRCAFARFCHREKGDAWELIENSGSPHHRHEAIAAASECPAGRLVAVTKTGQALEPEFPQSVDILQDPEENVSSGIYVKGGIPVESAQGFVYEVRNRIVLCRCGASRNKPFCDASHVDIGYNDKR